MEHIVRIAFWTLACLQASALPIVDSQITSKKEVLKNVSLSLSLSLSHTHKQERCITTALDCVMRELNGTVRQKTKSLTHECACEGWPQTPFGPFLNQVEALLQLQNVYST
uniref:Interleukin n=1 Tax=Labrus bergylta TaxID=56723 RepID=A0A3Q3E4A5_9LABR